MRRELQKAQLPCILPYNVPDHFLCHFLVPDDALPRDSAEEFALGHMSRGQPVVDHLFDPARNWNCTNMAALADEIDDGPMLLTTLEVIDGEQYQKTNSSMECL